MHTYPEITHRFEVWFTYGEIRRWRACADEEERDDAVGFLQAAGATDIDVVEK